MVTQPKANNSARLAQLFVEDIVHTALQQDGSDYNADDQIEKQTALLLLLSETDQAEQKSKNSATEAAIHAAIEAENQEAGELEPAVDNPILDTETIVSDQITAQQTPLALKESIKNNPLKLGIFSIRLVNAIANSFLGVPSAAVIIAADQILCGATLLALSTPDKIFIIALAVAILITFTLLAYKLEARQKNSMSTDAVSTLFTLSAHLDIDRPEDQAIQIEQRIFANLLVYADTLHQPQPDNQESIPLFQLPEQGKQVAPAAYQIADSIAKLEHNFIRGIIEHDVDKKAAYQALYRAPAFRHKNGQILRLLPAKKRII